MECDGRAGRPFPAIALSDVPRKPCSRALARSAALDMDSNFCPEASTPRHFGCARIPVAGFPCFDAAAHHIPLTLLKTLTGCSRWIGPIDLLPGRAVTDGFPDRTGIALPLLLVTTSGAERFVGSMGWIMHLCIEMSMHKCIGIGNIRYTPPMPTPSTQQKARSCGGPGWWGGARSSRHEKAASGAAGAVNQSRLAK